MEENGTVVKAVDPRAIEAATGLSQDSGMAFMGGLVDILVHMNRTISPWWSKQRDMELRAFWKDGESGSIVMGLAQNKLATIPITIVPNDMSIVAHNRQALTMNDRLMNNSEFGLGLHGVMLKFVEDYLGQDNGAFMEILGDGPADGPIVGPVWGLRHLDSYHCLRTGDPIYPVMYTGEDGVLYKIHNARVIFVSQMPSSRRDMFNVGFCSVSRSLRILQNMHNVLNYQDEKMGARAASQILVGSGITGREIIKTIAASQHMMDNLGLENLSRTIAIGSPTGDIKLDRIELNDLKTFDEETTKTFAAYALASAWGLEFQDLIPISGTKSSETISLQRARVRLPQAFMESFLQQANSKLVPPHLQVKMDFVDDQADKERSTIQDIDSRNFERQMSAGVTTPEVVQQIQFEKGYINRSQLRSMQLSRGKLENGAPVQSLFFNPNYTDMLILPSWLLVTPATTPEVALEAISVNKMYIYAIVGETKSQPVHNKAEEALAALEWLESEYRKAIMDVNLQITPDQSQEDEPESESEQEADLQDEGSSSPTDGQQTNQERGEVGKATNFFQQNSQQFQVNELMKQSGPWNRFVTTLKELFKVSPQT